MKKDVLVSISGLQYEVDKLEQTDKTDEAGEVEVISVGEYYFRNDKHFILYEEVLEGIEGVTSCTIKISEKQIDIIKRGANNAHMIFMLNKKNNTLYQTPFGSLQVGVYTTSIDVMEEEDKIEVHIKYGLDINYSHISDCEISIKITSKNGCK